MGSGYFFVGYDYLRQVLHLPEDAVIVGIMNDDPISERFQVAVISQDIKGDDVTLSPVMHSEAVYKVTLESWGEQIAQDRPKG
jgi:hypothetical protein